MHVSNVYILPLVTHVTLNNQGNLIFQFGNLKTQ